MSEYESNDPDINYAEQEEQNEEENENEEEQEKEQEQEQDQENTISKNSNNNITKSSNKSQNTNNNIINKTKNGNQITSSKENNGTLKNEDIKDENSELSQENPEVLFEEFFYYFLPEKKHTLNIKECKNAMRSLGLVVSEKDIMEYLEIKEKTGKERINLEEFKSICNKKLYEKNNNLNELKEAFEMLDPEKTGFVNSMIMRHQIRVFKPKITDVEIDQILSEFGIDKNGNINYREYLRDLEM